MANVNVMKKTKELMGEMDRLKNQYTSVSVAAAQLERELEKKKAQAAAREEEMRRKEAETLAEQAHQQALAKEEEKKLEEEAVKAAQENKGPVMPETEAKPAQTAAVETDVQAEKKEEQPQAAAQVQTTQTDNIKTEAEAVPPKKTTAHISLESKSEERHSERPAYNRENKQQASKVSREQRPQRQGDFQRRGYNDSFSKDKDDEGGNRRGQAHRPAEKKRDAASSMMGFKQDVKNFGNKEKEKDKARKTRDDYWEDGKPKGKNVRAQSVKHTEPKQQKAAYVAPERKKAIVVGDSITIKEFSEISGIAVPEIVKKLLVSYKMMVTINNEIDFDTAQLVADDFGITITKSNVKSAEERFDDLLHSEDDESKNVKRPPIVTVMGHVDHGKTSLLDCIRNSHVTEGEAGGITQHIGAYTVNHNGNKITFLDTPGHEAFTTMRIRGANVTDIAVIVVAANDGVMPQTIEAINHARAANTSIIIAMNKMDVYGVDPNRVKQQLAENNILVEDWGGDIPCIPVSAKTREGIDDLLEMILLVADMLELKANPDRKAIGTIIEARLDKGKGPVATVLVQNGTLREGDTVVAGMTYGNVRAMFDHNGKKIKKAGPSIPVEITGLSEVPQAGDMIYALDDSKLTRSIVEERINKHRESMMRASKAVSLDDLFNQIKEGEVKTLNIIIKADVQGSVEAVKQSLEKLSNDEVKITCIHGGVGAITEADVSLAKASNAIIIGFNVRTIGNVDEIAEQNGVDVRMYSVIYNAIDDMQAAMKGMLAPKYQEVIHGRAEVRMTFKVSGVGTIAGCYVIKGKVSRHDKVRIIRDGILIMEGEIDSLKRFKDDVKEAAEGYECGIGIKNFNDIKEKDIIEAYVMEEIQR